MRNKVLFFWVIVLLFSFYSQASASELCSTNGYTVLTINGIFTNKDEAIDNKDRLKDNFLPVFNNQPLKVDYIYNATHFAGASDLVDVVAQGAFNEKEDFDLTNMLNDASQKVTTQKLLLVAHSQGNFYANNFYDKVASQEGGIPNESIGIYSVATPANYVSGGGKYLTSDTDKVINSYAGSILNVLPPNIHIPLKKDDDKNGHSFSDVYLKYQSDRIVSDIKSSLVGLKNNDEQNPQESCISAPKLTLIHKIKGLAFAVADPTANVIKTGLVGVYDTGVYLASGVRNATLALGNMFSNLSASVVDALPDKSSLTTILPDLSGPIKDEFAKVEPSTDSNLVALNDTEPIDVDPIIENPTLNKEEAITSVDVPSSTIGETPKQNTEVIASETPPVYLASSGGGGSTPIETNSPVIPVVNEIVPDTTPPVITLNGNEIENVIKDSVYTDVGATVTDNKDSSVVVVTTGNVDTNILGSYVLTYTATDTSGNTTSANRTVNVINPPVIDTTPPVITLNGSAYEIVTLSTAYTELGATATDDIDGPLNVTISGSVDTSILGAHVLSYSATDHAGNTSTVLRTVFVQGYKYIPKYTFGTDNGDGNNWQVWGFSGSNIFDWSDSYVDNYLSEQFKIKTNRGYWCSQCLQRGIFNHDPQKGFLSTDMVTSTLEDSPQNKQDDLIYNVAIQWDSSGYKYTISHDGIVDSNGHTDIQNVNENTWVGWDGSYNNFQTFPAGNWIGSSGYFPAGYTGGTDMILQPYPVYKYSGTVLSKEKKINTFNFDSLSPSVAGNIDENNHTISLTVPFGTDVKNLIPTINISEKASVIPNSNIAQDFSNPDTYTVTAEDSSTQNYTVTVTIAPNPNPVPVVDTTPPTVTNYTFNNNLSDITVNPTVANPLSLVINASENVNWMSIKIEKEDDTGVYKTFQSGAGCVDGTNTCTKSWDGGLSKGGLLQSGTYKVKLHIKDPANNEFYNYLTPYVIKVDTSI